MNLIGLGGGQIRKHVKNKRNHIQELEAMYMTVLKADGEKSRIKCTRSKAPMVKKVK
jgi:hypothetical protein